ncbi:MAG: hypothetical protein ACXV2J_07135, partial [Actinomycetes bacterium]
MVSVNVARAAGPALAGLVIVRWGVPPVFGMTAAAWPWCCWRGVGRASRTGSGSPSSRLWWPVGATCVTSRWSDGSCFVSRR